MNLNKVNKQINQVICGKIFGLFKFKEASLWAVNAKAYYLPKKSLFL